MNKEEFLKIQNCVLKVHIHCDGCKDKVKKILQKIEGVYKLKIEAEEGRVTVCGNVDPAILIRKLSKRGKRAELWGNNNNNNKGNTNNQLNNQFKNLQIQSGKNGGGANNKAVQGGGHKGQQQQQQQQQHQPKGGQGQGHGQLPPIKGIPDLKLPQQFVKGPKMGPALVGGGAGKNPKAVKFTLPEDDGLSDDDEFDEFDDEDDDFYDHDDSEDEIDFPVGKMMKPQMPNVMMPNNVMNGLGKGVPGGSGGANGGGNGKKGGGGGSVPNHGGGSGGGGKKGGNGKNNGVNQNQGGKGGGGGGAQNKSGVNNGNGFNNANGAKKGSDGPPQGKMMMPNMMMSMNGGGPGLGPGPMGGQGGHMGNPPMGPGQGQMSNLAAVQGLPASSMNMNGGGFQGGNPYYPQQLAAMMVNQQHANGNERFQPMMYARPPAAVNYMPPYYPPYPYPYPGPPPPGDRVDQYSMFSDENANGCTVM